MSNPAHAIDAEGETMDSYDAQVWRVVNEYWERKSDPHALRNRATAAFQHGAAAAGGVAKKAAGTIPEAAKQGIQKVSGAAAEKVMEPAIKSVVKLIDLVNDWTLELNDPKWVETHAKKQGLSIDSFADLRDADLKFCDRLLDRNTLTWRTLGALEGGAMGALAMVPVAGTVASIGADTIVIQVLSTAIAARVAYSYGFDAKDPEEQKFIQRLVNRSFKVQVGKAQPMLQVGKAAGAINGRVNWSDKLRNNHQVIKGLEKLMNLAGANGGKVTVKSVGKSIPVVGVAIGAGTNSAVLGNVAADAKRYCQTRFLCEKYGLQTPSGLDL
ncbi:MAG: EcsC family protein [Acidipropionibacterium jensenii]|uniref:EcsC family protein n=1 Tax=Acidipropionibacterium jensenii TaxID=1749 RepID=UPI0026470090|nr:EcsC family protein [Acidipropionibacterium jensenii]MDN6812547.1 EcsC family protein [Acidipropionibacterium jensenii]